MKSKENLVKDGPAKRQTAIQNDGSVLNVDVTITSDGSLIKKHQCIITTQEMF
jgi:hypothetical protein